MLKDWMYEKHRDKLKVGLLLSVTYVEEPNKNYRSRITDIQEHALAIELPIEEGTGLYKPFLPGTDLSASFVEGDGAAYRFSTRVIKIVKKNISLLHVAIPEEHQFEKIQRRDYKRVPASLQLKLKHEDADQVPLEFTTVDVSGGGVAISSFIPTNFKKDDQLTGTLLIPQDKNNFERIEFKGRVLRVITPIDRPVQNIGIEFEKIEERDREKVIRYCFQREAELRKKLRR